MYTHSVLIFEKAAAEQRPFCLASSPAVAPPDSNWPLCRGNNVATRAVDQRPCLSYKIVQSIGAQDARNQQRKKKTNVTTPFRESENFFVSQHTLLLRIKKICRALQVHRAAVQSICTWCGSL